MLGPNLRMKKKWEYPPGGKTFLILKAVILSKIIFAPNSFMNMFNMSTWCMYSIGLIYQKLW